MSFKEYDRVRIKDKDVIGSIVEIFEKADGKIVYIVEDDEPDGLTYPLYDCLADELEKI